MAVANGKIVGNALLAFKGLVERIIRKAGKKIGITGGAALATGAILDEFDIEELWDESREFVFAGIVEIAREEAGLELDPLWPLGDESISAALTAKTGIQITSVKFNILINDLQAHVCGMIEERTGIHLTNLFDAKAVQADLLAYVRTTIQDKTAGLLGADTPGLDIGEIVSYNEMQGRIAEYLQDKLETAVVDWLAAAAQELANPSVDFAILAAMVDRAHEIKGGAKSIIKDAALGTAAALVMRAYAERNADAKRTLTTIKRRLQNRESQRRFREIHGNRMRYNPLPKQSGGGGDGNGAGQGGG